MPCDFAEHAAEAEAYANKLSDEGEEGRWWLDQYRLWRKAFEMAADGGAVYFH